MMKWLHRKMHNLSIQGKLLLSFLSICVVCFFALFFIGIPQLAKNSRGNILYSANQAQEQAQEYISYIMESLTQTCYSFAYNESIITIVSKSPDDYPLEEQGRDRATLDTHLSTAKTSQFNIITDVFLYLNDDFSYVSDYSKPMLAYSQIEDSAWYRAMKKTNYAYYLIPPEQNISPHYISVVHFISDPTDYSHFVGAVVMDTRTEKIETILQTCAVTPNSYVYLVNDEGILVASSRDYPIRIAEEKRPSVYSPEYSYDDENNLYSLRRLNSCGWTLIQVIPKRDIQSAAFSSVRYFVGISICILIFSVLLSLRVSSGMTRRIKMLSSTMRSFRYNETKVVPVQKEGDDIDYLLSSYNQLITDFQDVNAESLRKGQQLNETELALLHSQIKPHFLYNTLDMISTLAEQEKAPITDTAIRSLSGFYKSGLGNKTVWSTLGTELSHIRFYMDIHRLRYGDDVQLAIQVPDQYNDVNLPRVTLQPIVENALVHGIPNRSSKQGVIAISASASGDSDLRLTIRDNGCGMSQGALLELFQSRHSGKGIGLWNTNERIRLHYGASYGLTVRSVPDEYTEISILIPIIRRKEFCDNGTDEKGIL